MLRFLANARPFEDFAISERTIKKLRSRGFKGLFPVQYETFTAVTEGNDAIVKGT